MPYHPSKPLVLDDRNSFVHAVRYKTRKRRISTVLTVDRNIMVMRMCCGNYAENSYSAVCSCHRRHLLKLNIVGLSILNLHKTVIRDEDEGRDGAGSQSPTTPTTRRYATKLDCCAQKDPAYLGIRCRNTPDDSLGASSCPHCHIVHRWAYLVDRNDRSNAPC